jgi:hypothetical protein
MASEEHMVTELVPCGQCEASGKVGHWLFFKRDCKWCEGTGKRKFMYDRRIPADTIARLKRESILNKPLPGPWESAIAQTFQQFS